MRPCPRPILVLSLGLLGLGLLAATASAAGLDPDRASAAPETTRRERAARHQLENARRFLSQGELEAAARATARGLEFDPDNARLHHLRAELLEELGDGDAAARHRATAESLAPPLTPIPQAPLALPSEELLVVVLPPPYEQVASDRLPQGWPDDPVSATLRERVGRRLPDARVIALEPGEPASIAGARSWISEQAALTVATLRVERAYCRKTIKDGAFAVAWLRAASLDARSGAGRAILVRQVVEDPSPEGDCRGEAMERALERALELSVLRTALEAQAAPRRAADAATLRALFPSLESRLAAEFEAGREQLASGELGRAAMHFRAALVIDPDDHDARVLALETERALSLSTQLSQLDPGPSAQDPEWLESALSPAQRSRLETLLREELRQREELLAALAAIDDEQGVPSHSVLASLRRVEIDDPQATGPRLARSRAQGGTVEARVLYEPDGAVVARYYLSADGQVPLLREMDSSGDGRPDRWIAYSGSARREVWHDARGAGVPDTYAVFEAGDRPMARMEVDTTGDGRFDRVEHFDADGALTLREEDINGDARIDVRTAFESGRMVRREILDPEALSLYQ